MVIKMRPDIYKTHGIVESFVSLIIQINLANTRSQVKSWVVYSFCRRIVCEWWVTAWRVPIIGPWPSA